MKLEQLQDNTTWASMWFRAPACHLLHMCAACFVTELTWCQATEVGLLRRRHIRSVALFLSFCCSLVPETTVAGLCGSPESQPRESVGTEQESLCCGMYVNPGDLACTGSLSQSLEQVLRDLSMEPGSREQWSTCPAICRVTGRVQARAACCDQDSCAIIDSN